MNSKFLMALEEILDVPEGSIDIKTQFKALPEWDSLAALSVMVAIEEHFQKVIDPSIFKKCNTVEELINQITTS